MEPRGLACLHVPRLVEPGRLWLQEPQRRAM